MNSFHRVDTTWAAYLILALYSGSLAIVTAAMPFVRAELGLNYSTTAAYLSAVAVGILTSGLTGDRLVLWLGRRRLWFGVAVVEGVALVLLALARVPILVLIAAFFLGLGGAMSQILVQIVLPALHKPHRAVAIAEANLLAGISTALAPLLLGGLNSLFQNWRPAAILWALLIAAWLIAFRRAPLPQSGDTSGPRRPGSASPPLPPVFAAILPATFLLVSAEWCIAFWTPDFLHRIAGYPVVQASALLSVYFAAIVAGRLAGSLLSRRFTDRAILYASLLTAMVGLPVYWLAPWPALRMLGLFISGLGIGNHYSMIFSFATSKAGPAAEIVSSRMTLMAGAAIFSAPLLLGGLADRIGIFYSLSLVALLLAAALLAVRLADK